MYTAHVWKFTVKVSADRRGYGRSLLILVLVLGSVAAPPSIAQVPSADTPASDVGVFVGQYCLSCHNQTLQTAGLALDDFDVANPGSNAEVWERVIAKLRAGSMPPPGLPRADAASYDAVADSLERQIDDAWSRSPNPGRVSAVHRLNRTEYNNAIRDLFALELDVKPLLPGDDTADGSFDNIADVLSISTAHLERYMSVARQVTRLAVGLPPDRPSLEEQKVPLHVLQDDRQSEDLPLGSRGGLAFHYNFPVDGEYLIRVRLQRQYQEYLKGMGWPQRLDVRLDGRLLKRFSVGGKAEGQPAGASYAGDGEPGYAGDPQWEEYMQTGGDAGLEVRVPVEAGPRVVGVTFVRELWEPEGLPQPLQRGRVIANDQIYMGYANVDSVQIGGPYQSEGLATDTPSRQAIFVCHPDSDQEERPCAVTILSRLARLAYRRTINEADKHTLLDFFDQGRRNGGSFDSGIQFALERMLVDPDFLLRVHRAPATPGTYPLGDLEVASRLSFFLWSSIPDERLLSLAERGWLSDPDVLESEARRMLADPRATDALVSDFAAQWLNLRRIKEVVVDPLRYPNYDESLLQAFERETELFVADTLRRDRSVTDLLNADYTFVNERLARHYGISGIYGSRFRRVDLPDPSQRGGLLAQGSLLATTSYPDRTSPVLRGKWLLNNILGLQAPLPPPGLDTSLDNKPGSRTASIRERLARHRQDPSCNSCHAVIDPLGFALENFDVIGGWRTVDQSGNPVDVAGATLSGAEINGLSGLRRFLLQRPEQFPQTVTQKLLAYALGRMLDYHDQPAVRSIVREAAADDYSWSSIIVGIVKSPTFLMERTGTVRQAD